MRFLGFVLITSAVIVILQFALPTLIFLRRKPRPQGVPSCPEGPVVTIEDNAKGRLGNKMWKYASVWALGKVLRRPVFVPRSVLDTLSGVFANLSVRPLEEVAHCGLEFGEPFLPDEGSTDLRIEVIQKGQNLMLHRKTRVSQLGLMYLQELKDEFEFQHGVRAEVEETLASADPTGQLEKVGVHVRRTDFDKFLPKKHNLSLVNANYFKDAMQWYRDKYPQRKFIFLVVSDDVDWCQRNLQGPDVVIASKSPGHDLALMANCDHTIIDYGSFGYWGAILASVKGGHTVSLYFDTNTVLSAVWRAKKWVFFDPAKYGSSLLS